MASFFSGLSPAPPSIVNQNTRLHGQACGPCPVAPACQPARLWLSCCAWKMPKMWRYRPRLCPRRTNLRQASGGTAAPGCPTFILPPRSRVASTLPRPPVARENAPFAWLLWQLPTETFRNIAEIWRNTPLKSGTQAEQMRNTCGTNRHICGTNRKITGTNRNISGTLRQISGTRTATFSLIGTGRRFTRVQVALKRAAKIVSS
jgi:hypothetical protein